MNQDQDKDQPELQTEGPILILEFAPPNDLDLGLGDMAESFALFAPMINERIMEHGATIRALSPTQNGFICELQVPEDLISGFDNLQKKPIWKYMKYIGFNVTVSRGPWIVVIDRPLKPLGPPELWRSRCIAMIDLIDNAMPFDHPAFTPEDRAAYESQCADIENQLRQIISEIV